MNVLGGLNEKAVLCTENQTYDVKTAEISNSLLLVPDLKMAQATSTSPIKVAPNGMNRSLDRSLEEDDEENEEAQGSQVIPFKSLEKKVVKKIFHEYFECTLVKPRYKKTLDLLQITKYTGPENEYKINSKYLFTYNQLLDTAQCSNGEFKEGLKRARAFDIDGYIRVLDYAYEYRCITLMLDLINENSWALNEIDDDETLGALDGIVPEEVIIGLFNLYTKPSDIPGKFKYDEGMVSKIILLNILQPDLTFKMDEFMETWREALPEGMEIDESQLKGLAIIDDSTNPKSIKSLLEENLSENLFDRLRVLFKTKTKWKLEEIEPYIEYFTTPQLGTTAILAKYARSLTENGVRLYVSKH